jgi:acetylornithine deacetylase
MPTVVLSCLADEEYQFSGVRALTAAWREGKGPLVPRLPDAAIVAEPTGLDVIVAHKGVIRWFCHTRGRAAHSSQPALGDNAVYTMARIVTAIEHYAEEILAARAGHALCGPYTLNVGAIQGGTSVNIVPERCRIEMEIRVPPGGDPQHARKEVIEYLAREILPSPPAPLPQAGEGSMSPPPAPLPQAGEGSGSSPPAPLPSCRKREAGEGQVEHDAPYMEGPALSEQTNAALAARLIATVRERSGGCRQRGVPYATHAAFYSSLGVPSVVFGPGAIEQAHTAEEWIAVDQLQQAADILYHFIKNWRP